jgi:two-component system response regulator AtoC
MTLLKRTGAHETGKTHGTQPQSKLPPEEFIFGCTPVMASIRGRIAKLAGANIPVLLTGESGTGKNIVAEFIHACSSVAMHPFVQINCAALPANLMESELFGHERGAYTGALTSKRGRIEFADSGTLFLDEIAELDPALQAKLLHLLQDGHFTRLGAETDRSIHVRFIFATSRDLRQQILTGNFREDLFYRMDGVTLELPPLRERVEDIAGLAEYFLEKYNCKYNCHAAPLSSSTIEELQAYHWPGNIREFENLMRRYVILGSEDAIVKDVRERVTNLFQFVIPPNGKVSLKDIARQAVRQVERQVIFKVMEANGWKRKRSARMLKISYRALIYKLQELGVPSEQKHAQAGRAANDPPIEFVQ